MRASFAKAEKSVMVVMGRPLQILRIMAALKHKALHSRLVNSSDHSTEKEDFSDAMLCPRDAAEMLWSALLHGCEMLLTLLLFGKVACLQLSLFVEGEETASLSIGEG
jgi:hypothetical protein